MGSMANGELRALRIEAHRYFDRIHQSGLLTKRDAYAWLANVVSAPMSHAHIGQLSDSYCKVVIEESKQFLWNNQDRLKKSNYPIEELFPDDSGGECYATGRYTKTAS